MNQLVSIGGTSAGVALPLDELRDEGVVSDGRGGESLEIEETMLRVKRFDRGAWQVGRTDEHEFPTYMEQPAFCQQAKPTVKADDYHNVISVLDMVQKDELSKGKAAKRLDTSRATINQTLEDPNLYALE